MISFTTYSLIIDNVCRYSLALLFDSNLLQSLHSDELKLFKAFCFVLFCFVLFVKLNDCYACILEDMSEIYT